MIQTKVCIIVHCVHNHTKVEVDYTSINKMFMTLAKVCTAKNQVVLLQHKKHNYYMYVNTWNQIMIKNEH